MRAERQHDEYAERGSGPGGPHRRDDKSLKTRSSLEPWPSRSAHYTRRVWSWYAISTVCVDVVQRLPLALFGYAMMHDLIATDNVTCTMNNFPPYSNRGVRLLIYISLLYCKYFHTSHYLTSHRAHNNMNMAIFLQLMAFNDNCQLCDLYKKYFIDGFLQIFLNFKVISLMFNALKSLVTTMKMATALLFSNSWTILLPEQ